MVIFPKPHQKFHQQKQLDVFFKRAVNIYICLITRNFIIVQSRRTLQLSFHPPFEPVTALFTLTGLFDLIFYVPLTIFQLYRDNYRSVTT